MRLTPDVFWAMSLGEWRAAVNGFARRFNRAAPLARAELEQLMRTYPDREQQGLSWPGLTGPPSGGASAPR